MSLHPVVAEVTERIVERSRASRAHYLAQDRCARAATDRNASALSLRQPRARLRRLRPARQGGAAHGVAPNLAIVTAYNDMLSAHQPTRRYPGADPRSGARGRRDGAGCRRCAGDVRRRDPGPPGMELSLFSRDVIALSTAVALSHDMFDAALFLGICDKIVPGLLIGALTFGHLPAIFVPAGPMPERHPNDEKSKVRQLYAEGKVGRAELLDARPSPITRPAPARSTARPTPTRC